MSSITIRDIPPTLHRALKARAARNRRSLQSEIVAALEQAIRPRPVPIDEILERAGRFRAAVPVRTTDAEIRRFKRERRK
ncbi:MAG: FitA-like ribbon-helix-helix domain-containing protein [Thermoanaerobaculia bacterium]